MTVARNNIYVKADSRKVAYDGYAYANNRFIAFLLKICYNI